VTAKAAAIRILLVDDDEGDVLLMREGLKAVESPHALELAWDGDEALVRLRKKPTPDLIILDLNLPKRNGREVFAQVKADPALAGIPLVVLTTSTSDQDLLKGHDARRCAYLTKPMRLQGYVALARRIERFWLEAGAKTA